MAEQDVRVWNGSEWLSLTGPQGPEGPQGPRGLMGPQGDPGRSVNIIGTLPSPEDLPATGEPGDAYLINGDLYVWDDLNTRWADVGRIEGPQGIQGEKGDKGDTGDVGPANSLAIGTVEKGDQAAASITGTPPAQTLSLTLPKGDQGIPGDAATITVGQVTTLPAGAQATVTNAGTTDAAVFDFGIPRGADGAGDIIPIGSIFPFAGTVVPLGWLLCDGSAFDPGTYPKLSEAIGSAFGTKVPDLRGRFALGADPARALGATGGSATINKVVAHTHTVTGSVSVSGTAIAGDGLGQDHGHAVNAGTLGHTHSLANNNQHTHSLQASANLAGNHAHDGVVTNVTTSDNTNTSGGGSLTRVSSISVSRGSTGTQTSHSHDVGGSAYLASAGACSVGGTSGFSGPITEVNGKHSHNLSASGSLSGASAASTGDATVDVLNPFLAINYIIKAA